MDIKAHFDAVSAEYDKQRRQFIPCFDDFYRLPAAFLDFAGESPRVLDLGCGTGILSSFILARFPKARVTLADVSEKMLELARKRFAGMDNIEYVVGDYATYEFAGGFDMVVSALSIHHLPDDAKRRLYAKCYRLLADGGIFLNADQVKSSNGEVERRISAMWAEIIADSGLSAEEIKAGRERMKFDDPSTLEDQFDWLREAGFRTMDIIYKYLHFCVMYARK